MSFPITIDAGVEGSDQPGKFATFLHSGNRYQIQFVTDHDAQTSQLVVVKSTDVGATWARVGTGPIASYRQPLTYSCIQVGTLIYVVYVDNGTFQLSIIAFDMSSDTWGSLLAGTSAPNGQFPSTGEGSFPLWQVCISSRPSTGDLLVILASDTVTLNDVPHSICCIAVFTISGATWSAWSDLGYLDYADITTWDMIPCGIVTDSTGLTTVFMQQVSRAGPGDNKTETFASAGTFSWSIPLDVSATVIVERWGAGGGAQSGTGGQRAGGGGAYNRTNAASVTPGGSESIIVGAGGATGSDGGDSSALGDTANGGKHGTALAGGLGGAAAGGDVSFAGGNGGSDGGTSNGGGGGGSGFNNAGGNNGQDGQPGLDPPSAAGGTGTGDGGNGGAILVTDSGSPGNNPGGGGGGDTNVGTGTTGLGADSQVVISWVAVRNTHDCRLFFQQILSDNSLGSLTEITEGTYPSRSKFAAPIPMSFDCAIDSSDNIGIVFTGATSTSGLTDIAIGTGTDPSSLSFTDVTTGSTIDSCPAICIGAGPTYFCCYLSTSAALNFFRRSNGGGASLIGTLSLPNNGSYSRLQASLLVSIPEITWGVPIQATLSLSNED